MEGDGAGCVLAEVTETKACDCTGVVDDLITNVIYHINNIIIICVVHSQDI